ncbi:unnamed protein product [Sympodiomycopsis kandeliae]
MIRFLTLLSLLPFLVALTNASQSAHAHGHDSFVVRRNTHHSAPPRARGVADIAFVQSQRIAMERRYGNMQDVEMHKRHYELAKRWQMKEIIPEGIESLEDFLTDIMGSDDDADDSKTASADSADQSFGAVTNDKISQGSAASNFKAQQAGDKPNLGTVTVPLKVWLDDNGNEREVQADIKIGGKTFSLTQDTGSVTPWIKKSSLDKQGAKSKTTGKTFSIQYGIGEVSGELHTGIMSAGSVTAKGVPIGAATKLSKDLQSDPSDGLMGYGFKELSQSKTKTFLDRAFEANTFDHNQLCFAIGRSSDGTLNKSQMRFGGPDPSTLKGDLSWYPISKVGYWQIAIKSLAANGGQSAGVTQDAVVDTGTSIVPVGRDGAKAFFADVKGSKYDQQNSLYTFPCSTKINAVLTLKDGKKINIREEDLNLGKVSPGSKDCVASVVPLDTNGVTVLGLPFLRSSIACLDHSGSKVGLGQPSF